MQHVIKIVAAANKSTNVPGSGTGVIADETAVGWTFDTKAGKIVPNAAASPTVKLEPRAMAVLLSRINVPLSTNVPPV